MQAGREEEAVSLLEEATSHEPGDPQVWRLLGDILAERGDDVGAAESYGEAAVLGDREVLAHLIERLSASRSD